MEAAIQRAAMVRVYTRRGDAFADHAGEGLLERPGRGVECRPVKDSLPLLCAALVLAVGCDLGPAGELMESQAELAAEQAALIRQYRECLARAEADPEVDCFGYPTAGEVLDSLSD